MSIKVAINGFGRIGRNVLRIATDFPDIEIVAINDLAPIADMAHLLTYDSNYGIFAKEVKVEEGHSLLINGKKIDYLSEKDPTQLPWAAKNVDVVIESTGFFTKRPDAEKHLAAGAKKVLISAPANDPDVTVVLGVNEEQLDKANHKIVSNASCTTNALAPVVKVLHDAFGIEKATMTTTHSYTMDQRLQDSWHKSDLRRARSAALSIIPTSTGAAKVIGTIIPELKGKIDGISLRVPTPTVSIVDLAATLKRTTTIEEVNQAFKTAAASQKMKGYLLASDKPLVSIDFKGNPASSIVDLPYTMVIDGNLVKVLAWYDNEWGYSHRVVDLVRYFES
ncbi:MAG: type I glyceraldehyde-3-phosphate dehydrogenase [bacterium]